MSDMPAFQLGPLAFNVSPEFFEKLRREFPPEVMKGFPSREEAYAAMERIVGELFPSGITQEAFDALTALNLARLSVRIHGAVLTGVHAYPPPAN